MKLPALAIALAGSALAPAQVSALQDPELFRLSQVRADLPHLTVYADIRDAGGQPISAVPTERLTATVGAIPATVDSQAAFESTGEGIAYVFLIDISRTSGPAFGEMIEALNTWIDGMEEGDRAVVLTFGDSVQARTAGFTGDRDALASALAPLAPTDSVTVLYQAIEAGLDYDRVSTEGVPGRRAIVLFSDGMDEARGGIGRDALIASLADRYLPIYTIGFWVRETPERREGLRTLDELARRSGGFYIERRDQPIGELHDELRARIRDVSVLRLTCDGCVADGNRHLVNLNYSFDGGTVSDGLDVRLIPSAVPPPAPGGGLPAWGWAIGALLLAAIAGIERLFARKRARAQAPIERPRRPAPSTDQWAKRPPRPRARPAATVPTTEPEGAREGARVDLTVIGGPDSGKVHEVIVAGRIVIGGSREADLAIQNDPKISARHCELTARGDTVLLRDMESLNGTAVNGIPLKSRHRLADGDVLLVGDTELRVQLRGSTRR